MGHLEGLWEIETNSGIIWGLQYPSGGLQALSGYGIPTAQYVVQKAPGQHGTTHLGYVLNDRILQGAVAWRCASVRSRYGLYERRMADVYPGLNYTDNPLIFRRIMLDGVIRELHNVWYTGGVELDSGNGDSRVQTSPLELVARDPIWYDPDLRAFVAELAMMDTGDELVFDTPAGVVGPTSIFGTANYLTFGSSSINLLLNAGEITTNGSWFTFPTITILGPAAGFEIENQTSGQTIAMDYSIGAGETVTFDLRYGYKTVTTDALAPPDNNLVWTISDDSDLAEFCLWHDPWAAGGANDIRIFCGNATGATRITVAWYDRYLGA